FDDEDAHGFTLDEEESSPNSQPPTSNPKGSRSNNPGGKGRNQLILRLSSSSSLERFRWGLGIGGWKLRNSFCCAIVKPCLWRWRRRSRCCGSTSARRRSSQTCSG